MENHTSWIGRDYLVKVTASQHLYCHYKQLLPLKLTPSWTSVQMRCRPFCHCHFHQQPPSCRPLVVVDHPLLFTVIIRKEIFNQLRNNARRLRELFKGSVVIVCMKALSHQHYIPVYLTTRLMVVRYVRGQELRSTHP